MNTFDKHLLPDIPLAEASAYFIGLKKFAAPGDPPDESGALEGQFPVPVEQVLAAMARLVHDELATIYAYHVYAQSLRGLAHDGIAEHFLEHADDEQSHMDFLLKRMSVLGGPVQVPDIEAPLPSSDPVDIIQKMIRMEQEAVAGWRELAQMVGENAMRVTIEDYAAKEQEHLDDLWQLLPQEAKQPVMQQPVQAPAPAQEATAAAAEEPAMAGAVLGKAAALKMAEPRWMAEVRKKTPGAFGKVLDAAEDTAWEAAIRHGGTPPIRRELNTSLRAVEAGMRDFSGLRKFRSALRGDVKTGSAVRIVDSDHIEKAKQRAEANLAARTKTHQGTRGEAYGDVIGRLVGAGAGGAAGHRAGGILPALGAAALGQHLGAKAGRLAGKEVDVHRAKHGSAQLRKIAFDDPAAALQLEQAGAQAQEQNEAVFYKQKLQEQSALRSNLEQQLQQISEQAQQAQQQSAEKDQQLQALQQAQQGAQQAATRAMVQAVGANQQAIQHQQLASDTTMNLQNLRQQLRALSEEAQSVQAGPSGLDQGGPAMEGAAGQAPSPTPQLGQAETGAPTAPAGQADQGQMPGQVQGQPKQASGMLERLPYAIGGAALGAGTNLAAVQGGAGELQGKVRQLEGEDDGSFGHAINLAQTRIRLALRELSVNHPGATTAVAAGMGAISGAAKGPDLATRVSNIIRNVRG